MLMRRRLSTVHGITTGPGARPPTRAHAEQFDEFAADEPRRACLADTLGELRDKLLPIVRVEKREQWRQPSRATRSDQSAPPQVERMFPFNHEYWTGFTGHEYWTRFTGGDSRDWSGALLP
jgi:hypothetical protein